MEIKECQYVVDRNELRRVEKYDPRFQLVPTNFLEKLKRSIFELFWKLDSCTFVFVRDLTIRFWTQIGPAQFYISL